MSAGINPFNTPPPATPPLPHLPPSTPPTPPLPPSAPPPPPPLLPPPSMPYHTPLGERFVLLAEAEGALLIVFIVCVLLLMLCPAAVLICKRLRRQRDRQRLIDEHFGSPRL